MYYFLICLYLNFHTFSFFQLLLERVLAHRTSRQREALIWNAYPGALGTLASYGDSRAHLPIAAPVLSPPPGPSASPAPLPAPAIPLDSLPTTPGNTYTALLYVQATSPALHKLLANIAGSEFCEKVTIVSSKNIYIQLSSFKFLLFIRCNCREM